MTNEEYEHYMEVLKKGIAKYDRSYLFIDENIPFMEVITKSDENMEMMKHFYFIGYPSKKKDVPLELTLSYPNWFLHVLPASRTKPWVYKTLFPEEMRGKKLAELKLIKKDFPPFDWPPIFVSSKGHLCAAATEHRIENVAREMLFLLELQESFEYYMDRWEKYAKNRKPNPELEAWVAALPRKEYSKPDEED
jgi:hypothetical protein